MIGVQKMVKHRSKILQLLLQDFQRVFDYFWIPAVIGLTPV